MRKHNGPKGAPCPGCRQYLSHRDAAQIRAAHAHYAACAPYQAFMAARTA